MIEQLHPFAISFLIGLLIGVERERSHPAGLKAIGVRTFVLVALLGTFAAWFNEPMLSMTISIFVFSAILLGYLRSSQKREKMESIGLTTELGAGVVFCLGFITQTKPLIAAIIGAAVLLVLLGREKLHNFSRKQIRPDEIQAAMTLLVIGLGILPFLPNYTLDPWQLFNPQRFGILVFLISIIQFSGYITIRVLGERLGTMLTGFFGGFVSSTAVFINLPRIYRDRHELLRPIIAAGVLATVGMLMELSFLLSAIAPPLLQSLFAPIAIMAATGLFIAFIIGRKITTPLLSTTPNPLDLQSVLKLTAFIGTMMVLVSLTKHYGGIQSAHLIAFLAGLFEVQGISVATAALYAQGKIPLTEARSIIAFAILATYLTKFVLLWALSRNRLAVLMSVLLMVMAGLGIAAFVFT